MVTDRDICMCALFEGKPLRELTVGEAMTANALCCGPEDSLAQAERVMREGRVRRFPVNDDEGTLVGILSLADIAREAARQQCLPRRQVTEVEVNDTLAAICLPAE